MSKPSQGITRVLSLAAALISMCSTVFIAHRVIKLPSEPVWAPVGQIWENYVIALTVFIKTPYPLVLAGVVLVIMGLFGAWVGKRIGRLVSRFINE